MVLGSYKLNWKFARRWKRWFCVFFSLSSPSSWLVFFLVFFGSPSHSYHHRFIVRTVWLFLLPWFSVSSPFLGSHLVLSLVLRTAFDSAGNLRTNESESMWRNVSKYNIFWLVAWLVSKQRYTEIGTPAASDRAKDSERVSEREKTEWYLNWVKCAF